MSERHHTGVHGSPAVLFTSAPLQLFMFTEGNFTLQTTLYSQSRSWLQDAEKHFLHKHIPSTTLQHLLRGEPSFPQTVAMILSKTQFELTRSPLPL